MFKTICKNGAVMYTPPAKKGVNASNNFAIFINDRRISVRFRLGKKTNTVFSIFVKNKMPYVFNTAWKENTPEFRQEVLPFSGIDSFIRSYATIGIGNGQKGAAIRAACSKIIVEELRKRECPIPRINYTRTSLSTALALGAYPIFRELFTRRAQEEIFTQAPFVMRYFRHSDNVPDLVTSVFKQRRKSIISRVGNELLGSAAVKQRGILECGHILRGLIPVEHFDLVQSTQVFQSAFVQPKAARALLAHYPPARIIRMLSKYISPWTLSDILRQVALGENLIQLPRDPKTMDELHDDVSRQYRKLQTRDLPIPIKCKDIHKLKVGELEIVRPETTHELLAWGEEMSNCIASYGERELMDNKLILLGVKCRGELVYNIEIRNKRLIQFLAPHNRSPRREDFKSITAALMEKEVLIDDEAMDIDYQEVHEL